MSRLHEFMRFCVTHRARRLPLPPLQLGRSSPPPPSQGPHAIHSFQDELAANSLFALCACCNSLWSRCTRSVRRTAATARNTSPMAAAAAFTEMSARPFAMFAGVTCRQPNLPQLFPPHCNTFAHCSSLEPLYSQYALGGSERPIPQHLPVDRSCCLRGRTFVHPCAVSIRDCFS